MFSHDIINCQGLRLGTWGRPEGTYWQFWTIIDCQYVNLARAGVCGRLTLDDIARKKRRNLFDQGTCNLFVCFLDRLVNQHRQRGHGSSEHHVTPV